jgi:hypothetical protein
MCEQLICGQGDQLMHNIEVPESFWSRQYGDLFRALNCRSVSFTLRYDKHICVASLHFLLSNASVYLDCNICR